MTHSGHRTVMLSTGNKAKLSWLTNSGFSHPIKKHNKHNLVPHCKCWQGGVPPPLDPLPPAP